jgi:hypothetical protein
MNHIASEEEHRMWFPFGGSRFQENAELLAYMYFWRDGSA